MFAGPSLEIFAAIEGDGAAAPPRTVRFDLHQLAPAFGALQQESSAHRPVLHDPTLVLGRHLFEAVLGARHRGLTADHGAERLSLRLAIDPADPRVRWLLSLPWELLFDDLTCTFCALERAVSIVRTVAPRATRRVPVDDRGEAPILPAGRPLRILVAVASPRALPPLDAAQLLGSLRALASDRVVAVDLLEHASAASLRQRLQQTRPDVLHLLCHAQLDAYGAQSALLLEAATGGIDPTDAGRLESLWPPSLRLVTVDAAAGRHGASDPMAAVGAALALRRRPLVVSLQRRLSPRAGRLFGHELYRALAAAETPEGALQHVRFALASASGTGSADWSAPALYRNR